MDLQIDVSAEHRTKCAYGKWQNIYPENTGDAEQMTHDILTAFEADLDSAYLKAVLIDHPNFCHYVASLIKSEGIE